MLKKGHDCLLLILCAIAIAVSACGSGGSSGGDDSAETDTGSMDGQTDRGLVLSEIMYNPGDGSPEFLEIVNGSEESIDISGYTFTDGITYTFKDGTELLPGEIIVLSDTDPDEDDTLARRVPDGTKLFAPYEGRLADGGEELELRDDAGRKVFSITYGDLSPWPVAADGFGYSLVVADASLANWGSEGPDWRASAAVGGSPGTRSATDAMPDPKVRINEVLTHTDGGGGDAIELYNDSATAVDVGGWYLSDDKDDPAKFRIPDQTLIDPYGYLLLYERYDPANSANLDDYLFGEAFQLAAHGEQIFLFAAEDSIFSGYAHGFSFGEVENNISFGRYVNASGKIQFVAQRATTLGAANDDPYVGYVVISEIMYHADGVAAPCNFIEITNTGNNATILFDQNNPDNTWAIRGGISFSFPETVTIRSDERIVLIAQDPFSVEDFREFYGLDREVQIYKYDGILDSDRQTLEVLKPEDPMEDGTIPYMVVDRAGYDEDYPGLTAADGTGVSVERVDESLHAYGDDYTNWDLSAPGGTPGR